MVRPRCPQPVELADRLGLAPAFAVELLRLFVERGEADCRLVQAAVDAAGDRTAGAEAAHSLKGASLALGLDGFADLAGRAEAQIASGDVTGLAASVDALAADLAALGAEVGRHDGEPPLR